MYVADIRTNFSIPLQSIINQCNKGNFLVNNTEWRKVGKIESFLRWLFSWLPRVDSVKTKCLTNTFTLVKDSKNQWLYKQIKCLDPKSIEKGGDLYVIAGLIRECWKLYIEPAKQPIQTPKNEDVQQPINPPKSTPKLSPIKVVELEKEKKGQLPPAPESNTNVKPKPLVIQQSESSDQIEPVTLEPVPTPRRMMPPSPRPKLKVIGKADNAANSVPPPLPPVPQIPHLSPKLVSETDEPEESPEVPVVQPSMESENDRMSPLILEPSTTELSKSTQLIDKLMERFNKIKTTKTDPKTLLEKMTLLHKDCSDQWELYSKAEPKNDTEVKFLTLLRGDLTIALNLAKKIAEFYSQKIILQRLLSHSEGLKANMQGQFKTIRRKLKQQQPSPNVVPNPAPDVVSKPEKSMGLVKKFGELFRKGSKEKVPSPKIQPINTPEVSPDELSKVQNADYKASLEAQSIQEKQREIQKLDAQIEKLQVCLKSIPSLEIYHKILGFQKRLAQMKAANNEKKGDWETFRHETFEFQTVMDEERSKEESQRTYPFLIELDSELIAFSQIQNEIEEKLRIQDLELKKRLCAALIRQRKNRRDSIKL